MFLIFMSLRFLCEVVVILYDGTAIFYIYTGMCKKYFVEKAISSVGYWILYKLYNFWAVYLFSYSVVDFFNCLVLTLGVNSKFIKQKHQGGSCRLISRQEKYKRVGNYFCSTQSCTKINREIHIMDFLFQTKIELKYVMNILMCFCMGREAGMLIEMKLVVLHITVSCGEWL